jgi:EmrB/QacA subfamily drug resistance transporter
VSGLGVAIGPVTGGFLLQHFWWGSVFLVNVPVVVVALIATRTIVPPSKNPDAPPLDLVGTLLSVVGLVSLLYAIIEAPTYGWGSPRIIATLLGGLLVLALFALWELHTDHPVLNVRFFSNPRFSAASAAVALVFFALFGSLFFLTQYLQDVLGYNALEAGLRVAPVALALMVAAPTGAVLVGRIGTKFVVASGLVVVSCALFLLSRARLGPGFAGGYPLVFTSIVLLGIGMGLAMSPATDSIMGSLPVEEAGVGSAVNDTTREIGGALGVAILGSLLNASYRAAIGSSAVIHQLPASARAAAANSVGAAKFVATTVSATVGPAAGKAVAHTADAAFVHAMTQAVIVAALVALGGAVVALVFLPSFPPAPTEELNDLAVAAARTLPPAPAQGQPALAHASMGILSEAGHASLNFNAISAQSGVATAAMQRGWRGRHQAVVSGLEHLLGEPPQLEGRSLLDDVTGLLRHLVQAVEERIPAPVLSALIGAAGQDPELGTALRNSVLQPREQVLRQRLEQAASDGELAADVDRAVLVDMLLGPVYHRALITGEPLGTGFPDQVAAMAVGPHLARSVEPVHREP